jgi:hypothetical protein
VLGRALTLPNAQRNRSIPSSVTLLCAVRNSRRKRSHHLSSSQRIGDGRTYSQLSRRQVHELLPGRGSPARLPGSISEDYVIGLYPIALYRSPRSHLGSSFLLPGCKRSVALPQTKTRRIGVFLDLARCKVCCGRSYSLAYPINS